MLTRSARSARLFEVMFTESAPSSAWAPLLRYFRFGRINMSQGAYRKVTSGFVSESTLLTTCICTSYAILDCISRLCLNEICYIGMIELSASLSCRRSSLSRLRGLAFKRPFVYSFPKYFLLEHRGIFCRIYVAACAIASGMQSGAFASSTISSRPSCSPGFFSANTTASSSYISSTGTRPFLSISFKAKSSLLVVVNRYRTVAAGRKIIHTSLVGLVFVLRSFLSSVDGGSSRKRASSALSSTIYQFPFFISRSQQKLKHIHSSSG